MRIVLFTFYRKIIKTNFYWQHTSVIFCLTHFFFSEVGDKNIFFNQDPDLNIVNLSKGIQIHQMTYGNNNQNFSISQH